MDGRAEPTKGESSARGRKGGCVYEHFTKKGEYNKQADRHAQNCNYCNEEFDVQLVRLVHGPDGVRFWAAGEEVQGWAPVRARNVV